MWVVSGVIRRLLGGLSYLGWETSAVAAFEVVGALPSETWNKVGIRVMPILKNRQNVGITIAISAETPIADHEGLERDPQRTLSELGLSGKFTVQVREKAKEREYPSMRWMMSAPDRGDAEKIVQAIERLRQTILETRNDDRRIDTQNFRMAAFAAAMGALAAVIASFALFIALVQSRSSLLHLGLILVGVMAIAWLILRTFKGLVAGIGEFDASRSQERRKRRMRLNQPQDDAVPPAVVITSAAERHRRSSAFMPMARAFAEGPFPFAGLADRALRTYKQRPWPIVVKGLGVAILATWLAQWVVRLAWGFEAYQAVFTYKPGSGHWWTLLTSLFAHRAPDQSHLLENLLGLAILGVPLARWIGNGPALALFITGGTLSAFVQGFFDSTGSLGASGGLTAWFGAAAVLWHVRRSAGVRWWPYAAPVFPLAVILWEGASVPAQVAGSGMGHVAHATGAAMGFLVGLALVARERARAPAKGGSHGSQ